MAISAVWLRTIGLAAGLFLAVAPPVWPQATGQVAGQIEGPATVVDGDTLDVQLDGETIRVRIEGIDAPEAGQTCRDGSGGEWRCGRSASSRLEALIAGESIRCTPHGVDDYDRVIATCVARTGEVDLGAMLVDEGLAWAFRRYSHTYVAREDAARVRLVGIS